VSGKYVDALTGAKGSKNLSLSGEKAWSGRTDRRPMNLVFNDEGWMDISYNIMRNVNIGLEQTSADQCISHHSKWQLPKPCYEPLYTRSGLG
jgi:hypothetical protein